MRTHEPRSNLVHRADPQVVAPDVREGIIEVVVSRVP
jgi:hypothetical protein